GVGSFRFFFQFFLFLPFRRFFGSPVDGPIRFLEFSLHGFGEKEIKAPEGERRPLPISDRSQQKDGQQHSGCPTLSARPSHGNAPSAPKGKILPVLIWTTQRALLFSNAEKNQKTAPPLEAEGRACFPRTAVSPSCTGATPFGGPA